MVENETQARVMTLGAAGYEGPDWMGYEEALAGLVRFMIPAEKRESTVNLIGFKDDEPRAMADLMEIRRMLRAHGIRINAVLTACRFEEVRRAPKAALNVLVGGDGALCADRMVAQFGTPRVTVPYPFGLNNTLEFLKRICSGLGEDPNREFILAEQERIKSGIERIYFHLQGFFGLPVAVVGEAQRARDFALFACDELGLDVKNLVVSSANTLDWEKEKEAGRFAGRMLVMPDKFEMDQAIASAGVELIFGTTMERKLAYDLDAGLMRISFPVLDMISVSNAPYAGFNGVLHLIEAMVNTVISRYEKVEKRT
jgi:nitrogenase molybdenum-iron protein beta chain